MHLLNLIYNVDVGSSKGAFIITANKKACLYLCKNVINRKKKKKIKRKLITNVEWQTSLLKLKDIIL